jgi:hypothetical protein
MVTSREIDKLTILLTVWLTVWLTVLLDIFVRRIVIFIIDLLDKSRILTIDNEILEHDYDDYFNFALLNNKYKNAEILYTKYPVRINDIFNVCCIRFGWKDSYDKAIKILNKKIFNNKNFKK